MPRPHEGPKLFLKARSSGRAFWYIRWTPPGSGRSREYATGIEGGPRPEKALADFITETVLPAQAQATSNGKRDPAAFTIGLCLAEFASEHVAGTSSAETVSYNIEALAQWWDGKTIADIKPETCKRYAAERVMLLPRRKDDSEEAPRRTRKVSPGTTRRELAVLSAAVNHARKEGRLEHAPFVWMPPSEPGRERWLTRQEAAALIRAARRDPQSKKHLPKFILITLYTGARKRAVLDLQWTQVDFVGNKVALNPTGRRQTKKKRPVVPMPDKIAGHMRRWQRKSNSRYVVSIGGEGVGEIRKGFAAAVASAGLGPEVTPHVLRHTCGTWQAQAGVDLWLIGGWLGHSHARTTELYAHHHPDHMRESKQALDRRRA